MMPPVLLQSPDNKLRAAAIASELLQQDFDILCLEKSFDGGARDVMVKQLAARYPYRYGPANDSFSLEPNSGVWVLSRLPLSDYHQIQFRDAAGIERLSRKGALLLKGTFRGHRFQILATHLQGEEGPSYTEAHQKIRDEQMQQIRDELLAPHADPALPLFLCGDFDTPREVPAAYNFMLDTFDRPENGVAHRITLDDNCAHNDLARFDSGRAQELDYVLVRPNGSAVKVEWARLIMVDPGWDGRTNRRNLSYKYAVAAAIEFQ